MQKLGCVNVSKVFKGDGVETFALEKINTCFVEGELVAIVGPSGSGKSTLLSLIGALDVPSEGEIIYRNESIHKYSQNRLADFRFEHIGFIFQQFHLLPALTALENVMSPLFSRKVSCNKKERAESLLSQVGLADKLHALPSQLSGGQQQRVVIARALVHEPSWLLADEPTGNLDTDTGELIFVFNVCDNTTIVFE
ncbi:ABC transporter ATP-binding protein [Virgibacillus sp. AGTR]|uniref:ABC transporter ATP-binding protein n=1 Tax=Virgibacillus TaxID=84406 RepID=UPI000685E3D1|nr:MULTISPECIES: ABC transporter ATP-binding protein [Bacillaceae]MCC2251978.1 ABC transporter ATP-binding protein [Virgibacillus sp. AGTR]